MINNFLNYFLNLLDFRYYYTGENIVIKIDNNSSWKTSNIYVPNVSTKKNLTVDSTNYSVDSTIITADLTIL